MEVEMKDFDKALKFVLKWEGFISDDKNDRGGLTIWGISYKSYPKQVLEMKKIIDEEEKDWKFEAFKIAEEIYYQNYWLKAGCDTLPFPFNIVVFDTAVNMGRRRAKEFLDVYSDWRDYLLKRLYTYSRFKQAKLYFRGWANRTLDLYMYVKKEMNR